MPTDEERHRQGWPVIHHNTIFDGKHPADCGAVRAPATDDWRDVSCPACLASQKGAGPGSTTS